MLSWQCAFGSPSKQPPQQQIKDKPIKLIDIAFNTPGEII